MNADINRRFDRLEEELDNLLIEIREARQELRALRAESAKQRCRGVPPVPPTVPPTVPYTTPIRPWGHPWPRITWYCENSHAPRGGLTSGYVAPVL